MTTQRRRCQHCRCYFRVCPKVKKHEYCRKAECQRARRRSYQKKRMESDAGYRADQKQAQKDWMKKSPDYWQNYRKNNPEYTAGNRDRQRVRNHLSESRPDIAKMNAISPKIFIESGRYTLLPVDEVAIAKMNALTVEIHLIPDSYKPCDSKLQR